MNIKLSKNLSLPIDVVGEAIGILATRGAGKSYASAALVEELFSAGIQFAVLDPTGVYHGLRSSANGKNEGLPIIIIGGPHGDVPLEDTAGALIADLLVDTSQSLILDLSDLPTKKAQAKFVAEFAERLYRRKARNRTTLHLVIDEADEFAPQKPLAYETMMLHHIEVLVRRGRSRGIGMTLITQRSATLNKNVLDLIDTLIAMRVGSPRDRKAVTGWIAVKGEDDKIDVDGSLPSMATGTAWIWSPVRKVLKKVQIRRINTFDSYATPKPGKRKAEPRKLADIDINQLGDQIKATAERAKENDPKELHKQIRELKKELELKQPNIQPVEHRTIKATNQDITKVVKAIIAEREAEGFGVLIRMYTEHFAAIRDLAEEFRQKYQGQWNTMRHDILKVADIVNDTKTKLETSEPVKITPKQEVKTQVNSISSNNSSPELRILNAIFWWKALGVEQPVRAQVAFVSGYKPSTGNFNNILGKLKSRGLVDYPGPKRVSLTLEGMKAFVSGYKPSTGNFNNILGKLKSRGLVDYPGPKRVSLTLEGMKAFVSGYKPSTGNFNNILGKLKSRGLVDYPGPKRVSLTLEGMKAAEHPMDANKTDLIGIVKGILSEPQWRVLHPIVEAHPSQIAREDVAEKSGYLPGTGNFNNILGKLRKLELIDYPDPGMVKAESILFP